MDRCTGGLGQSRRTVGVIVMRMGEDDVGDRVALRRRPQSIELALVGRAGVDDRDLAGPDDVAVRALEGERAGIGGRHPAHAGRHGHRMPMLGREVAAENEVRHPGGIAGQTPQRRMRGTGS